VSSQEIPTVIIAGPTASGKSAAAMELAMAVRGEILCADSMQVYRDLRVLTARPGPGDEARVPHHLYGHVDGKERYSAGRFVREAIPLIEDIKARRRLPILCGGTGLYLRALTEGFAPVPEVPGDLVQELEALWDRDCEAFRADLLSADPAMARLEPADRQRHVRAMAVLRASGQPLSHFQEVPVVPPLEGRIIGAVLAPGRETLHGRIDRRFEAMLRSGALQEVEALLARNLPPDLPVMKALGVREVAAILEGEDGAEAMADAQRETRRFAKRQLTWFRNQTSWPSFADGPALIKALLAGLGVTSG
jgi:tRNA dimethylallyltransferase